jgi:hypothetical protein
MSLLLAGCAAAKKQAKVPGCPMAIIKVPDGCYLREFPDSTEVHCSAGVTKFECTTKEKR